MGENQSFINDVSDMHHDNDKVNKRPFNEIEENECTVSLYYHFLNACGLFRFKCLNYGISCTAEIFQTTIRETPSGVNGVLNISDENLVFGSSQPEQ